MPSLFKPCLVSACGLILALAGQTAFAESNTTFLVDTATSNTADYALGLNGTNNVLIVTNGAKLVNTGLGYIGSNSISDYNRAYVSGEGSAWSNENSLYVGNSGNSNSLFIARTGLVSFGYATIGMYGNGNSVSVSSGGKWTNAAGGYYTTIGYVNDSNKLILTNGGIAYIGSGGSSDPKIGNFSSADGNELIVVGAGSVVYAGARITCGYNSHASSIIVSNGGLAVVGDDTSGTTWIGRMSNARENRLLVTGSGSLWSNRLDLIVGLFGGTNYLTVNNGGQVWSESTYIGQSGSWNVATIAGNGAILSNTANLFVGSNGWANSLIISNGGYVSIVTGFVGHASASSNNVVSVSGAGSILSNRTYFYLGYYGGSNTAVISDGGKLGAYMTLVGTADGSDNNLIDLTGTNSLMECTQVYLGNAGDGNSLMVSNGATLNSLFVFLGNNVGADNNTIMAAGNGSVITGNDFYAGMNSDNNRLYVTNGAAIYSQEASVGYNAGSDCNSARLDGSNSRWISPVFFTVGKFGASNNLSLYNGGTIQAADTYIGQNASASNNWALISGSGSLLTNSSELFVGGTGAANYLVIANGGRVCATDSYIGFTNQAVDNWVSVSGNNSVWSNGNFLLVGYSGSSNALTVSDNGLVTMPFAYIGNGAASARNRVLITGSGILRANNSLSVGNFGHSNELVVNNGGQVTATVGIDVGYQITSSNNAVSVSGTNSLLTVNPLSGGQLKIGLRGVNHSLLVSNNAAALAGSTIIGDVSVCQQSRVAVNGNGSILSNTYLMAVGQQGQDCKLFVENSGKLISQNAAIGNGATATNNEATVRSYGVWSNLNTLYVGNTGAINRLIITNRGDVYSGSLVMGREAGSTNNQVAVYNSTLTVTGLYNIIHGTNVFDTGLVRLGTLYMTNSNARMDFRRGTLSIASALVSNGSIFYVGDGASAATNLLVNNGVHYYLGGMAINNNSALAGNGTVIGTVLLVDGARLAPGESAGTLTISNLMLYTGGSVYVFEKSSSAADLINVNGILTFSPATQLTVLLRDLGGASFVGTNTLITYGAIAGTPSFAIDYGTTGLTGYSITNNTVAKRIELVSQGAPAAPETLAASGITTNSFAANWSASANATNYFFDVAADSSFTSFVSGYNNYLAGNVTSVIVNGLTPNTIYYYRLRAQGLEGTSANSATITVTTYPLPPASAPTGVSATKGAYTDRVRITWNSVSNATVYEVWRHTANDSSGASHLSNDPAATAYEDTTVTVGTTYYYWVKARNASGTSAFSSSASGFASATVAAPSAPAGVSASKGAYPNKVVIVWNTVTNASSYEVWRNTVNDSSTAAKFDTEPSLATYEDTSVTVNAVYYYWLKAKNSAGTSGFSASDMGFASLSGDTRWLPVSGDFDGDALSDPAVYQPLTGAWKTRLSSAGYLTVTTPTGFLGGTNWTAVAADFDGDAQADLGVYNATSADWMLRLSSANYEAGLYLIAFLGGTNWAAHAADFDGDRLADPTVYDSATANWSVKLSSAGYSKLDLADFFGGAGWTALGADFDGDAQADPAVYESATGGWSLKLSSSGYAQIDLPAGWLGGSVWLAAAGDYDGDAKADPAIYDPATGDWSVKLSSAGYNQLDLSRFLGGME